MKNGTSIQWQRKRDGTGEKQQQLTVVDILHTIKADKDAEKQSKKSQHWIEHIPLNVYGNAKDNSEENANVHNEFVWIDAIVSWSFHGEKKKIHGKGGHMSNDPTTNSTHQSDRSRKQISMPAQIVLPNLAPPLRKTMVPPQNAAPRRRILMRRITLIKWKML